MSKSVSRTRLSGVILFALFALALSSPLVSATPVPPCLGCECIGPANCDGCIMVYSYQPNGTQNKTAYWVNVTGSHYRTCVATSASTDCSTGQVFCWTADDNSLPKVYEKEGCNRADEIILILQVGGYLGAGRTGCGTGQSQ